MSIKILPFVKKLEIREETLKKRAVQPYTKDIDYRLKKEIEKLPCDQNGAELVFEIKNGESEKYSLDIGKTTIKICADGMRGAFYALQSLKQIFLQEEIPCLHIEDEPDFEYRGLYHDVTRGKIATVKTIKKLIDDMAYYKMNSLQLYIEHVFEFEETKDIIEKTGYLTKDELKEIDEYCTENFIEFIPSIATFGHMYEILEQDKYKHLRVLKNFEKVPNFWDSRMRHHTIDPLNEESIELVKSLTNQIYPLVKTEYFNICGDETFDLKNYTSDTGKVYTDFVIKIINHLKSKNKKIMMWADILLQHPENIEKIPDDIIFLNWNYLAEPPEENIIKFKQMGRKQIVCPGTGSWNRFCENVDTEEKNISLMAEYGFKHGAIGVLNTNWGDWGNPSSIETAMYGIVLGAEKSWCAESKINEEFYDSVNFLLYGNENAIEYLKLASRMQDKISWTSFCRAYFKHRFENDFTPLELKEGVLSIPDEFLKISKELSKEFWKNSEAKEELLLCFEGLCVMAQLSAKLAGVKVEEVTSAKQWLKKYRQKWIQKNKESELSKIEEMITYVDNI